MNLIFYVLRILCLSGLLAIGGCQRTNTADFRFNSVELLKQERLTLPNGSRYSEDQQQEIKLILHSLFGTPDRPRLPQLSLLDDIHSNSNVSTETTNSSTETARPKMFQPGNLEVAAGAVRSDENGKSFGLYREHCANCHGLTGDGAGATAGFLNPYPRDFRLGKFKFKSTPLRQAPTHQDLMTVLKKGIPGTAMPAFHRLDEAELEALADYVRYLSIRGQTERYLISELAQLDNSSFLISKHPVNAELSPAQLDEIATEAIEQMGEEVLSGFFERWLVAESKITPAQNPPKTSKESNTNERELSARIEAGRNLYFGKGNCAECHGDTATGPVATNYYDDWTSDWIKSSGIDIERKPTYRDFLKAGALPPRTLRPRNLQLAVMRGGDDQESIYRKIANGIEGTPMPSSAATLRNDEIWDLVVYVQSLGYKQ